MVTRTKREIVIGRQLTASAICAELHGLVRRGTLHSFPFDAASLPRNGIYVLFERGEESHEGGRIVRVGTHVGDGRLVPRLNLHFVNENKDTSIFRKNVGLALLNRTNDPFTTEWQSRQPVTMNASKRRTVEAAVTKYLQGNFTFVVLRVDDADDRKRLESKIISTVSLCDECKPSVGWFGLSSPKRLIRTTGLWLVNELFKEPLSPADIEHLETLLT